MKRTSTHGAGGDGGQSGGRRTGPFRNKRFYLDLRQKSSGTSGKALIGDILALGGVIDEFFSREITTVVTDGSLPGGGQDTVAARGGSTSRPGCNQATPSSHATNGVPSPQVASPASPFLPSPSAVLNGVWSPASPATPSEDRPKTKSRAEAMLERSRQHVQQQQAALQQQREGSSVFASPPPGGMGAAAASAPMASPTSPQGQTSEVVENAQRWGLQVWSFTKTIKWINNHKSESLAKRKACHRQPSTGSTATPAHRQSRGGDKDSPNGTHKGGCPKEHQNQQIRVQHFRGPFIKYECSSGAFRPVFQELKRFPQLSFTGKAGSTPFYVSSHSAPTAPPVAPPLPAPSPLAAASPHHPPAAAAGLEEVPSPKKFTVSTVSNPIKHKLRRIHDREVTVKQSTQRDNKRSQSKSGAPAATSTQGSPSTTVQAAAGPAAVPAAAGGGGQQDKPDKKKEKGKKPGYCELCDTNFDALLDHLEEDKHKVKVESRSLWADLDISIGLANQVYSNGMDECDGNDI